MNAAVAVELHFRLATPEDIPRLTEIVNAAFTVETFMEGTRTNAEQMAEEMATGSILVALDQQERICGTLYFEPRERCGYLGMLAVAPEAQKMGVARNLTEEAYRRLREAGCQAVEIVVLSLRNDLMPLYHRWGFVETGPVVFDPGRGIKPGFAVYGIRMERAL